MVGVIRLVERIVDLAQPRKPGIAGQAPMGGRARGAEKQLGENNRGKVGEKCGGA